MEEPEKFWREEAPSSWGHPPSWFRDRADGLVRCQRTVYLASDPLEEGIATLRSAAEGLIEPELEVAIHYDQAVISVEGWRRPTQEERLIVAKQKVLEEQRDRNLLADLRARRPDLF